MHLCRLKGHVCKTLLQEDSTMDYTGTRYHVGASSEHGDMPSHSMKGREYSDELNDYQPCTDCAAWIQRSGFD